MPRAPDPQADLAAARRGCNRRSKPEVWVVGFDPDSGEAVARLRTKHPDFGGVTGVVESGGKLWMSTIEFPAVAHCRIP